MQNIGNVLLVFLFLLLLEYCEVYSQDLGEACNKGNGICTKISDCQPIINNFNLPYTRCNSGRVVIACCPKPKEKPVKIALTPEENSRKHVQACNAFKAEVFEKVVYFTAHAVGAPTTSNRIDNCKPLPLPLIHDGERAKPQEFSHMALLGNKLEDVDSKWFCGGTLISKKFVLTAAHCLFSSRDVDEVRLAELDYRSNQSEHVDFGVKRIIPHPEYNSTYNYNDIGLVELDREATISKAILPACLPTSKDSDHEKFIATGWGSIKFTGPQSSHLLKVVLDRFSDDECKEKFRKDYDNLPAGVKHRIQLCAGSKNSLKDTCQGDSGGPLVVRHSEHLCMYTVVGITSFGDPCGMKIGNAGIYTRVDLYIDWLELIVWADNN